MRNVIYQSTPIALLISLIISFNLDLSGQDYPAFDKLAIKAKH